MESITPLEINYKSKKTDIGLYNRLFESVCISFISSVQLGHPRNLTRNSQAQHGMGPFINMQKSVFLPLWDNYELYGCKIFPGGGGGVITTP